MVNRSLSLRAGQTELTLSNIHNLTEDTQECFVQGVLSEVVDIG